MSLSQPQSLSVNYPRQHLCRQSTTQLLCFQPEREGASSDGQHRAFYKTPERHSAFATMGETLS